jgi:hypothetical protein
LRSDYFCHQNLEHFEFLPPSRDDCYRGLRFHESNHNVYQQHVPVSFK